MPSTSRPNSPPTGIVLNDRRRDGIQPMLWSLVPSSAEFRIDRLKVNVRGRVQVPAALHADWYQRMFGLAGFPPVMFLTQPTGRPGRLVSKFRTNDMTVGGRLYLRRNLAQSDNYHVEFKLDLNPTRTFSHLDPADVASLAEMEPVEFFSANPSRRVYLQSRSLDGSDNFSTNDRALSPELGPAGSITWLGIYETKLKALCEWILFPPPAIGEEETAPPITGELDWEGLVVPQVEAYLERNAWDAMAVGSAIARNLLGIGREVSTQDFPAQNLRAVGRLRASTQAALPLTKEVTFQAYAKTENRLRFEVRYNGYNINRATSGSLPVENNSLSPLCSMLSAYCDDARHRLERPWQALQRTLWPFDADVPSQLARLASAVRDACIDCPDAFADVFARLLRQGCLHFQFGTTRVPPRVVDRLLDAEVLEHYRLLGGEARDETRTYALAPMYLAALHNAGLAFTRNVED